MKLFGDLSRIVKLIFAKSGNSVTVEPSSASADTVFQLPPAAGGTKEIVTADSTNTLTNKTISGASNTLSNIPTTAIANGALPSGVTVDSSNIVNNSIVDADINSSAAITLSKLAALTASRAVISDGSGTLSASAVTATEVGYLSGVTSAIQTQLNTNATGISDHLSDAVDAHDASAISSVPSGNLAATDVQSALNELQSDVDTRATSASLSSHTGASSGVHGISGNVVGTTDSQTLTNKVVSSTAAMTGALTLPSGTTANRSGLTTTGMIRHNTDTNEFEGYTNGTWQSVGGGVNELPLKNYLKTYATASVAPGTLSTLASATDNLVSLSAFYADSTSGSAALGVITQSGAGRGQTYLTAVSGADTAGGRFVQFPIFRLDPIDMTRPVSVSFEVVGNTADDNWDVVIVQYNDSGTFQKLIPIAGNASSMTSTPSAKIPVGQTQFRGFFVPDSDSALRYAVRFRRRSGSDQLYLDTLYVGPQQQLSSAAVTDWQSYTPTLTNMTATSVTGKWRRIGDSLQATINVGGITGITGAVVISIPSGLTLDLSKLPYSTFYPVGIAKGRDGAAGNPVYDGLVGANNTTTLTITRVNGGNEANWSATVPVSWTYTAATTIDLMFEVPISNWSSNVTMADRAVEEYAADDGSADVFGPNGALVPNVAATTGSTSRDFVFQSVQQATDFLPLEYRTSGGWASGNLFPWIDAGTWKYGMRGYWLNSTTFRVEFGNGGGSPDNGIGVASGGPWSGKFSSGERFRVRKVSGGAAVGYPINDVNVIRMRENVSTTGNIDNLTVGSGITVVKFTGSAPVLRGFASNRVDGQIITIISATGTSLTINNQDTNSTAENRIITGSGAAITITTDGTAVMMYDGDSQRWRIISTVT